MSVPPNDPSKYAVPPGSAPVEEPLEIEPDEAGVFDVAGSLPAVAPKANWYVGRGGRREGPFDLAELRRQVQTGELKEADLLWREGMPTWTAAREVGEVFAVAAPSPTPPPAIASAPVHVSPAMHAPATPAPAAAVSSAPMPAVAPHKPAAKPAELLAPLERFLARPAFYRLAGYIAGGFGVLAILASCILWYWGRTWFGGAVSLIVLFFVCEAAAAILDALQSGRGAPRGEKQR
jgi:type IV secretory pathway VirB2 component (pilin)